MKNKTPILCAAEREEMEQKIMESVHEEFERFKEYELSLERLTIFNSSYQIHFYDEIHEYFTSSDFCDRLSDNNIICLYELDDSLISLLYDYYLSSEFVSIDGWDSITNLVVSFSHKPICSWDEIYERAENAVFGSPELAAKDEARHQLGGLILEEKGVDVEDTELFESAEEEIDNFLKARSENIWFDEYGNIIKK